MRVVVVDDGSATPVQQDDFDGRALRRRGAAPRPQQGARRPPATPAWPPATPTSSHSSTPTWCRGAAGWRRCSATSAIPPSRWSRRASSDCAQADNLVARYEAVRSSLDLGQREAPVVPYGTVSYVPSAAIICRRSVLEDVGGFDETLQVRRGRRPVLAASSRPAPGCGTSRSRWSPTTTARSCEIGSRARLFTADRRPRCRSAIPDKTAPLVISGWTLVVWILMAMGSGIGYLASMVVAAITGRRIANSLQHASRPSPRKWRWSPRTACGRRRCSWRRRSAGTTGRSRWSRRCCPGAAGRWCWSRRSSTGWWTGSRRNGNADDDTKPIGLLTYLLLKRLDDIAYGLGLWTGVVRERQRRRAQAADPDLTPPCT